MHIPMPAMTTTSSNPGMKPPPDGADVAGFVMATVTCWYELPFPSLA